MFDLKVIIGESSNKLGQFTDALTGHIQAIKTIGYRPYKWSPLLLNLIVTKLDKILCENGKIIRQKIK